MHLNYHQVSETIQEDVDLSNILKTPDTMFSPSVAININSIAQQQQQQKKPYHNHTTLETLQKFYLPYTHLILKAYYFIIF